MLRSFFHRQPINLDLNLIRQNLACRAFWRSVRFKADENSYLQFIGMCIVTAYLLVYTILEKLVKVYFKTFDNNNILTLRNSRAEFCTKISKKWFFNCLLSRWDIRCIKFAFSMFVLEFVFVKAAPLKTGTVWAM